jgi:hypothetical protein
MKKVWLISSPGTQDTERLWAKEPPPRRRP